MHANHSSPGGFAARAGRWSARHRKTAIAGWLLFVVLAVVAGGAVGKNLLTTSEAGVGESGRAARAAAAAFPQSAKETVLVQHPRLTAGTRAFDAATADVMRRLRTIPQLASIRRGAVSRDRHAALVTFSIPGGEARTKTIVDQPLAEVAAAAKAHPRFRIEQSGDASTLRGIEQSFEENLGKAESTSLPLTLAILIFAFGALVAAGLPLLLAFTGVAATLGLVGPLSQLIPVDQTISNVILLIGLAVGVDYSLFYLKRVREERAAGRSNDAAIEAAAATSGRAVFVSGLTVMVAMAGMYLAGSPTFVSLATGTIVVVAVSVLGSLSVLPAALSLLGDRVEKGRIPFAARRKRERGIWTVIVDAVLRRPKLSALASAAVLLALAVPALGMKSSLPGTDSLSRAIPAVRSMDHLRAAFPAENAPAYVVVQARDVTAPAIAAATARLETALARHPELFPGRATTQISPDRTLARIAIPAAGSGNDATSKRGLALLRDASAATVGRAPGATASIDGFAAQTADFNASLARNTPIVFAFVLGAAFLLLLVTFRSLVIPAKAILLNLLSVGAAYGVLVAVFQGRDGFIVAWLPLFLFVVLFGLSMDYHVFVLSRVREAYDRGMRTQDAVAHGIKSTAGVITSAALVMVGVFALFGTLDSVALKQMGVGLAVAVALDATIIRGILLPASMKLLGEWNWWLPRELDWLPRVSLEGEPVRAEA
ncbi:MAG TPA: MMPL family transporter [Solirubrobacteraceae bacterium]|jgi:RND superfamily putative drug exporter